MISNRSSKLVEQYIDGRVSSMYLLRKPPLCWLDDGEEQEGQMMRAEIFLARVAR